MDVFKFDEIKSIDEKYSILRETLDNLNRNKLQEDISVIVATYNRLSMLLTFLYSTFCQKEVYIKVYLISDNSTDQTNEYMKRLSELHPEYIQFFNNSQNLGPSESRKKL